MRYIYEPDRLSPQRNMLATRSETAIYRREHLPHIVEEEYLRRLPMKSREVISQLL